jgi:hypothetical protein
MPRLATKESATLVRADGSSHRDSHPSVRIDLTDAIDRWRYTCPNGHRKWSRTNNHLYCRSCAQHHDVDPEYYELLDQRRGRRIPWSAVIITDEN